MPLLWHSIPTFLQRDCLNNLLPYMAKLVNYSLSEGLFSDAFKKAVISPLIKKALLPDYEIKNYRPVPVSASGPSWLRGL